MIPRSFGKLGKNGLAAFCGTLLAFGTTPFAQANDQETLAIKNVALVDATGAPVRRNMTVVVARGRIASIGSSATTRVPKRARIVSGKGRYLIPGLWDAHVHALWDPERPAWFFPLFIANGVTNVREMGGPMPAHEQVKWRERTASGAVLGPDLILSGPFVDGPRAIWPGSVKVANEQEARQSVDALQQAGVDFIKVYSQVPRAAYFALAEEARKRRIPFVGHVPLMIDVAEASDAGQASIEHLMAVPLATSSQGEELKSRLLSGVSMNQLNDALVDSYDETRASALFKRFARNNTWHVPTLTIRRARPFLEELAAGNDHRLRYMSQNLISGWAPRDDPRQPGTPALIESRKRLYRKELEIVGAMHRTGVRIAAGTDTPNPYCFPGFSLHDELALLVEAGLSAMEALQAATRNPALMTGRDADWGTIEKGKRANLVLLGADPVADIRNVKKIESVILRGRLLTQADLTKMLAEVAERAKAESRLTQ